MAQDYGSLTLEIQDSKIINVDRVIEAINNEESYNELNNLYNALVSNKEYSYYENINMILFALKNRMKYVESLEINNPLNELINIYVTLEEVYPLVRSYINYKSLNDEDLKKIYAYLSNAITILENGFDLTSSFEYEMFDCLINYISNKEKNIYEEQLLNKYKKYIEISSDSKGLSEGRKKTYGINSNPAPLLLGDGGISLTIIIITVTVLVGTFLATLMLVK